MSHEQALRDMEQASDHLEETVNKLEAVDASRREAESEVQRLKMQLLDTQVRFSFLPDELRFF